MIEYTVTGVSCLKETGARSCIVRLSMMDFDFSQTFTVSLEYELIPGEPHPGLTAGGGLLAAFSDGRIFLYIYI